MAKRWALHWRDAETGVCHRSSFDTSGDVGEMVRFLGSRTALALPRLVVEAQAAMAQADPGRWSWDVDGDDNPYCFRKVGDDDDD